jgi:hypothetical protein
MDQPITIKSPYGRLCLAWNGPTYYYQESIS